MTQLLTINDVAQMLALKPMTIRKKIYEGLIPYIKIGKSVRIRVEDIEQIIKEGFKPKKEVHEV